MQDKIDDFLLQKFLANEATATEADEVYLHLQKHPELLEQFALIEDLRKDELMQLPLAKKEKSLQAIIGRKTFVSLKRWIQVAALFMLVFIGVIWLLPNKRMNGMLAIQAVNDTIKNETTRAKIVMLRDSSLVLLNPGGVVVAPKNNIGGRFVTVIAGDVFFKVAKEKFRPFIVYTNGIATIALGTQFWVQRFSNETLRVTLNEGKVMLSSVDDLFKMTATYLTPAKSCYINKETGSVVVSGVQKMPMSAGLQVNKANDAAPQNAPGILWTDAGIELKDATLGYIFRNLEKRYGIPIIFDDASIGARKLTGKLFYSDSLSTIIQSICQLNNLSYEQRNDSIFLSRK